MIRKVVVLSMVFVMSVGSGVYMASEMDARNQTAAANAERYKAQMLNLQVNIVSRIPNENYQVLAANTETWRNSVHLSNAKEELETHLSASQGKLDEYGDQVFPDASTKDALATLISYGNDLIANSSDLEVVKAQPSLLTVAISDYELAHEAWKAEETRQAEEARIAEEARQAKEARQAEEMRKSSESASASPKSSSSSTNNNTPRSQGVSPAEKPAPAPSESSPEPVSSPPETLPAPAPAVNDLESKALGLLSQYGCSGVKLSWDTLQLPSSVNGAAAAWDNVIYLRASMPSNRLNYVVAHECAHILQWRAFGSGNQGWRDAIATMNSIYGGTRNAGLEQNADCITKIWGFSQSHYTQDCSGARGDAARAVLNGHRP